MIDAPPVPTGSSPEARFMRWVYERLLALRSQDVQGARTNRTTRGIFAAPPPAQRNSPGLIALHVKEVRDEYLVCRTWDGNTEGTQDMKVAKPNELMNSRVTEVLPDGTTLTFSGWDNSAQSRHADGTDGTSEDQFITPRYLIADATANSSSVIYAQRMNTFAFDEAGNPIALGDVNRAGRAYAAES